MLWSATESYRIWILLVQPQSRSTVWVFFVSSLWINHYWNAPTVRRLEHLRLFTHISSLQTSQRWRKVRHGFCLSNPAPLSVSFAFSSGLQPSKLKASGWSPIVTRQPRKAPESMLQRLSGLGNGRKLKRYVWCVTETPLSVWNPSIQTVNNCWSKICWSSADRKSCQVWILPRKLKIAPVQALSCTASPHLKSGSAIRAAVRRDPVHLLLDSLGWWGKRRPDIIS